MNEIQESSEPITEFRLSKKKFILNLIKLIPKMKAIRKKAEKILFVTASQKLKVKAPTSEE